MRPVFSWGQLSVPGRRLCVRRRRAPSLQGANVLLQRGLLSSTEGPALSFPLLKPQAHPTGTAPIPAFQTSAVLMGLWGRVHSQAVFRPHTPAVGCAHVSPTPRSHPHPSLRGPNTQSTGFGEDESAPLCATVSSVLRAQRCLLGPELPHRLLVRGGGQPCGGAGPGWRQCPLTLSAGPASRRGAARRSSGPPPHGKGAPLCGSPAASALDRLDASSWRPRRVAARSRTGRGRRRGAVRRRRRQAEIYSRDPGLAGPCDRVSSEPMLSHPHAGPGWVGEETHERSDSRSVSRRCVLDPRLGVSVATLANTTISATA